jgi:hypothetical protein
VVRREGQVPFLRTARGDVIYEGGVVAMYGEIKRITDKSIVMISDRGEIEYLLNGGV